MLGHLSNFKENRNYMFHRHIYPNEIKKVMKKIKDGKIAQLDNILTESIH